MREAFGPMRFEPAQLGGQSRCSLLVTALPTEQRGICPPFPVATDDTPPVHLPCQVDREARKARSKAVLNWEPAPGEVQPTSCFRVEIRFVVDALGVPEPGTVSLTSMNNGGIGAAFAAHALLTITPSPACAAAPAPTR